LDRRVQTYADEKAEIVRLCTFEGERRKTELVKACKVGSTWYAAARVTNIDGIPVEDTTYITDPDGSITFGAVFRAPLGLIKLLSNLKDSDSYAHAWRQRCRDWAAIPDYEEGDKIKLATPVTLTDGSTCLIITATHYRRGRQKRRCYRIEETGGLVRLSKATLAGSELLTLRQHHGTTRAHTADLKSYLK